LARFATRDLLAQLGTIVRNSMRRRDAGADETFPMITRPNDHQRRALELLGVANRL
jgi:hypothetical protein